MQLFFEALMIFCFGLSWPISISKSIKARTTKGKSVIFLFFINIGYAFGITSKLIAGTLNYVIIFYIINFILVSIDIIVYFRNRKLDLASEKTPAAQ